MKGLSIY